MSDAVAEIRKIIAEEDAAWNAGDAVAFSRWVRDDAVFTNIFGQQFVGHAAFEKQHAFIFGTIYAGSKLKQTIAHLRLLTDAVAAVNTECEVTGAKVLPPWYKSEDGVLRARLLQVLVRARDGWWISAYHNVAVSPPPDERGSARGLNS